MGCEEQPTLRRVFFDNERGKLSLFGLMDVMDAAARILGRRSDLGNDQLSQRSVEDGGMRRAFHPTKISIIPVFAC